MVLPGHRRGIQPAGEGGQRIPHLAKPPAQGLGVGFCQLPDRADTVRVELAPGGRSHIQKVLHRQRVDNLLIIVRLDAGDGVGLFVITAQFCSDFVVGNADAHRDAQFPLDPVADLLRHGHGAAEQPHAAAHIRPTFIQAERLDLVGVVLQDLAHITAVPHILAVVRRHDEKVAAALLRLPDRHARLDAHPLGGVAGGQHDAVAVLLAAADGDAFAAQGGVFLHFDRGIKRVGVDMEYGSARHTRHPLWPYYNCIIWQFQVFVFASPCNCMLDLWPRPCYDKGIEV